MAGPYVQTSAVALSVPYDDSTAIPALEATNVQAAIDQIKKPTLFTLMEDFAGGINGTGSGVDLGSGFISRVSGGTVDSYPSSGNTSIGARQFNTGITTTGRAGAILGGNNVDTIVNGTGVIFNGGSVYFRTRIVINSMSVLLDRFQIRFGLGNTVSSDPAVGVYFEYDDTQSLNWRIKTAAGGVRTTTNTASIVGLSYTIFSALVNPTGTSVTFYINDISVGTITTNIPTNIGFGSCTPFFSIIKSTGTTTKFLVADYFYIRNSYILDR